jgi:hypothetical protein
MSAVKLHSPGKTIGSPVMADPLTSEYVQGSYIIRAPPDRAPRREVLRWLQGLDLSHSVRNVRRDAANGYVVAEICSRYFPSDINMHSFENGASLKVKANNWDQLVRFCRRAAPSIRLERDVAEGCMRMTPGFALELIEKMYVAFTRKTLAPAAPVLASVIDDNGREPTRRMRGGSASASAPTKEAKDVSSRRAYPRSKDERHVEREDSVGLGSARDVHLARLHELTGSRGDETGVEREWSFASVDAAPGRRRRMEKMKRAPPPVVRFEGIQTLPQETAARARARLAMEAQLSLGKRGAAKAKA